jgi:hypothetical protein
MQAKMKRDIISAPRLTHLQDTVTPLVYQQVTEPVRIVFLGKLFQVVRTAAFLSC